MLILTRRTGYAGPPTQSSGAGASSGTLQEMRDKTGLLSLYLSASDQETGQEKKEYPDHKLYLASGRY